MLENQWYVLLITQNKYGILVTTADWGAAEVSDNNNDTLQVNGL